MSKELSIGGSLGRMLISPDKDNRDIAEAILEQPYMIDQEFIDCYNFLNTIPIFDASKFPQSLQEDYCEKINNLREKCWERGLIKR